MKLFIQTPKGYVTGFNAEQHVVEYSDKRSKAKKFKNDAELNHWLDLYVNMGYGLSWSEVTCYRTK